MRIIGVTGGMGSGKSLVAQILKGFGARIIDADKIARDIVKPGEPALIEIRDTFGEQIISDDNELDRKALANIVFKDKDKVAILNKITHKYIIDRIVDTINTEITIGKYDTIVIDVPIPVQHGFLDTAQEIWVITANREARIQRVMGRSGFSRLEAETRIDAQMKEEDYIKLGHHIIENNSSLEELKKKLEKLYYPQK